MNSTQAKAEAQKTLDEAQHSAAADKAKGQGKQLLGNIKQQVGKLIGDEELQAKGAVQRADGKKDEIKGNIKEKIEDVKDTLKAGAEVIKEQFQNAKK
ncbi:CsbD family protein [Hydrocarboniphaga sp.]|uniref:CsbD family protein n=1 Tax=Hydrocarboniphaga sp. TaxID=2033016 RepID=UPI003D108D3F